MRVVYEGLAFFIASVAAECSRDGLIATAQTFLAAQMAGKTGDLKLSPSNFTYMENNLKIDISKSLLNTALKFDLNRTTADTTQCASYTMFISSTGAKPYVVATQIRHPGEDTATISMIDQIVATTGSLFFDAKKTLGYVQAENWGPIDASKRATRETLKKYGDGYLDMWTDAKAAGSLQWGSDCERVEGSSFTKPCGASLPRGGSSKPNGNRRYVIDETVGSVDVLCSFDSLGDMPDSHEVRVEDGKVKYVHTVTVTRK